MTDPDGSAGRAARRVDDADAATTLAAALRRRLPGRELERRAPRSCDDRQGARRRRGRARSRRARVRAGQTLAIDMTAPRPRAVAAGFRIAFEDAHLVVIEKPSGHLQRPLRTQGDRHRDGPHPRRLAPRRQARDRDAALHRPPHRQGHLGPALLRQDPPGRARAARASSSATRRAASTWPSPRATSSAARIESQLVADRGDGIRGSTRQRRRPGPARRHPRRPPIAAPAASATLCRVRLETGRTHQIRIHLVRGAATRWSARRSTSAICCARAASPCPPPRLMLHAATLGLPAPGHRRAARPAPRRRRPTSSAVLESLGGSRDDCRSDGDHPLRPGRDRRGDARSATAPNAQQPQDLPDGGHDPAFLERAAPLLEFLWSRYFRVRLLGIENVPDDGAALLVGNHSGGIPYDGAMLLLRHPPRPPAPSARAPAGRQLRLSLGLDGQRRRAHRRRARVDGDGAAAARAAASWSPSFPRA